MENTELRRAFVSQVRDCYTGLMNWIRSTISDVLFAMRFIWTGGRVLRI